MPGLEVHLVTPEREVWSGEADFVSARGVDGDLGVLPGHAPLLAALAVGPVFIDAGGSRTAVAVDGGFLHVAHSEDVTRVDILAEHAVASDELGGGTPYFPARAERIDLELLQTRTFGSRVVHLGYRRTRAGGGR